MTVGADILALVETWCGENSPDDVRSRARLEADVVGNKVTIFECTRMSDDGDWLRVPSAQLRLDPRTRVWALYWIDGNDRWHIVQATPSLDIQDLLAEIEADPDALFFG